MAATPWLIRRRLRRRWQALVGLALVVAAGGGGALTALGAAERTDGAYDRYVETSNVGDLVINPSADSTAIAEAIRNLPGVVEVTRDALLFADIYDGAPAPLSVLLASDTVASQVRGSTDGRYLDMDRPVVTAGRLPSGAGEAFVTSDLAGEQGLRVGDEITVSLFSSNIDLLGDFDTVVEPIGIEDLTVVGIGTVSGELLPDGLFPHGQLILSPDVAERYDCLADVPDRSIAYEDAVRAFYPDTCARSYGYYSLRLEDGAAGVAAATEAFLAAAEELQADLPQSVLDSGAGYYLIATTTADEQARVDRATQPTVTSLRVLGVGAGIVTLVVLGLAAARELRRSEDDIRPLWYLGLGRRERASVLGIPIVVAVVGGGFAAVAIAWLASPVAPVGVVGNLEPHPDRTVSVAVVLAASGFVVLAVALVAAIAGRAARRSGLTAAAAQGADAPTRVLGGIGRPALDEGIRAAVARGRGAGLVIASGALATATLVTAVVFGGSLAALVGTPASYGWPWDAAVLGGMGYSRQDADAVRASLDHRAGVETWAPIGIAGFTLDDRPVPAIIGANRSESLDLTLASGSLPDASDEVAVAAGTAEDLDVEVGDEVVVGDDHGGTHPATITGIVVLPAIGPYQSDRAAPGIGIAVPAAMFDQEQLDQYLSFMGLHLDDETDPAVAVQGLSAEAAGWAVFGDPPILLDDPVRPAEIVDAAGMRVVPLVVGGLLALAAATGLSSAVIVSVRARRQELGTLRVLGFTGRQLRNSVRIQAVVTMAVALALGLPLGTVSGRLAWQGFAEQLGVATDPTIPMAALALTALGGIVVAVLAATGPARAASRATTVVALRPE